MGTTVSTELIHHGERRDRLGRRHLPAQRRHELLAMFRDSGLSRQAFARREGIRYTTFCTWVHQEQQPGGNAKALETPVRFTQVQIPAPECLPQTEPLTGATHLEVRLPDGTTLRGNNANDLAVLVRALRD